LIGAGNGPRGHDCYFGGLIDEVCLYDRALTESEIQAIYDAGAAGKTKPALCHIEICDSALQAATDFTSAGR